MIDGTPQASWEHQFLHCATVMLACHWVLMDNEVVPGINYNGGLELCCRGLVDNCMEMRLICKEEHERRKTKIHAKVDKR